jgi:integral membrane protein (TIGR01906 family)
VTGVRGAIVSALVGGATILVLVAIGIAPFFTPLWIYPGQDRAQAEAWTGWPTETVHQVTGEVLVDLLIGPPTFDQAVDGQPVFTEAEASHLRDVRRVVLMFGAVAIGSAVVLVASLMLLPRRHFWRAVAGGAKVMAVGVVALGIFSIVAFDAAFELFHRLFFAAGTYSFDPATSRLVQLFPDAFWSETAIAIGVVLLVLATLTFWYASRAAGRADMNVEPLAAAGGGPEDAAAVEAAGISPSVTGVGEVTGAEPAAAVTEVTGAQPAAAITTPAAQPLERGREGEQAGRA